MIRILIVEDDENISKMLAATLSIGDYEYDRCADGEEAVQTIINGTYDLILLDVMLPGMGRLCRFGAHPRGRLRNAGDFPDGARRGGGQGKGSARRRRGLHCKAV